MIIGVGGIDSYSDIKEFWRAGGSFTQIYTSLIYHGPELLKTMARGIEQDLKLNNFDNVQTLWENIKEID
jgi:dihydroorotate dehydrogenase